MQKTVKKIMKTILIVILVVVAALICFGVAYLKGIPVTHTGLKYAEKYRSSESSDFVGFVEQDFGEYEEIEFRVRDIKGLFRSVGSLYTVTYSPEQYEQQLAVVDCWDYLEDAENENSSGDTAMPAVEVQKNGWTLRVLACSGEESYPKQFGMVGTNDDSQTIVYLYFTDLDLDFISDESADSGEEELESFIEEYFGFKFE